VFGQRFASGDFTAVNVNVKAGRPVLCFSVFELDG